jgi:hypothetical protein
MSNELLDVVRQLATDEDFRASFLADPKKHLADLGLSAETVKSLAPALMAAVAAGGVILPGIDQAGILVGWK